MNGDQPVGCDKWVRLGAAVAMCMAAALLSLSAIYLSIAIVRGEIPGNAWAVGLGFGIPAAFCAWISFRLFRGRQSANGVTILPTWSIELVGVFLTVGTVWAAVSRGDLLLLNGLWVAGGMMFFRRGLQRRSRQREALFDAIREAFGRGALRFREEVAEKCPGETMYAFLFEVNSVGVGISAVAAMEEGLARRALRFIEDGYRVERGEPIGTLQTILRWHMIDLCWYPREYGWYRNYEADHFHEAHTLMQLARGQGYLQAYDGTLIRLCLETLQALDQAAVFGTGPERERIVLGIYFDSKDSSDEKFLAGAAEVNPPAVVERLRREIEEGRAAAQAIIAPQT